MLMDATEPISAEQLHQFAECFRQVNFDDKTFMPCYGLAENALAVSFSDAVSYTHLTLNATTS